MLPEDKPAGLMSCYLIQGAIPHSEIFRFHPLPRTPFPYCQKVRSRRLQTEYIFRYEERVYKTDPIRSSKCSRTFDLSGFRSAYRDCITSLLACTTPAGRRKEGRRRYVRNLSVYPGREESVRP